MPSQRQLLEIISIQSDIAKLGMDLGEVMRVVVERTLPLLDADGAAIELAEGEDMVYRATSGSAAAHLGLRVKRSHSLSGLCVQEGRILRCDDSETDPRVDREACRAVGLRSMIVMPLRFRDNNVGVLKAMSARPGHFSTREEQLIGLLAEVIGAAMFHATQLDVSELFHKATHDHLTGLANRALFMDRLRNLITPVERRTGYSAVLILDMDGLKGINDTYGHRAGDAVLREFGQRIQGAARQSDTVARLGGDEFAVILNPVESSHGVDAALHRLQERLAHPFIFEGNTYSLCASIGAASYPQDSQNFEHLIELADQRMYAAKRARRSPAPPEAPGS